MNIESHIHRRSALSLRILLPLLVCATCPLVGFGDEVSDLEREEEATEYLASLGTIIVSKDGKICVTIDGFAFNGHYEPWAGEASDLDRLSEIGPIDRLDISIPFDSAKDLTAIKKIPEFRSLHISISGPLVWDREFMSEIAACPSLEEFVVDTNHMTDDSLVSLQDHKSLKQLRIFCHDGKMTRASLDAIVQIKTLEEVCIYLPGLTDDDLETFLSLPNLKKVRIKSPKITEAGCRRLVDKHPTCDDVLNLRNR